MKNTTKHLGLAALLTLSMNASGNAQCLTSMDTLEDPLAGSNGTGAFGRGIAGDGERMLTSYGNPPNGWGGGAETFIEVHRREGLSWILEQTIMPGTKSSLGQRVLDIDGDTFAFASSGVGVLVYERGPSGWSEAAHFPVLGPSKYPVTDLNETIVSVAVSGDTVVVGFTYDDFLQVFQRTESGWVQLPDILDPQPDVGKQYPDVDIDGDRIVWAQPGDHYTPTPDPDQVHVFERIDGVWVLDETLELAPEHLDDRVGHHASISGNEIALTTQSSSYSTTKGEPVLIYEKTEDGWAHTESVLPFGYVAGGSNNFSMAMDFCNDTLVVRGGVAGLATAHVFTRLGGSFVDATLLFTADGTIGQGLCAMPGGLYAVGGQHDGSSSPHSIVTGVAGMSAKPIGQGLAGSEGKAPRLSLDGCLLPGESISMRIEDGRPGAMGTLLIGASQSDLPFYGGTLYVGGPLLLDAGHVLDANGEKTFDFILPPALGGLSVFAQAAYDDPAAPNLISMTGGLRIELL